MNRSCSAVPQRIERAPVRCLPEPGDQRAHQQLLGKAHAGMRWHLERAELDETKPAGRAVRRIELVDADLGTMRVATDVDQQMAENAIDQPRRRRATLLRLHFGERDLQLIELIVAGLVDARRLTGRADEQTRRTDTTTTDGSANS